MNLVIAGGGEIGALIAEELHRAHDVTVIDPDESRARDFEAMDVRFLVGNAADPEDLRAAGTARADAFLACTSSDDINVLSCLAAKGLGAKETLAFVTRERYVQAFRARGAMEALGLSIDRLLWPQRTMARQIADIVRVPRAVDSAVFAGGLLKMLEYRLQEGDPLINRPLAEVEMPRSVLVVGSIRGESFVIPSGATVLRPGDKVVMMGTRESMRRVESLFAPRERVATVAIAGGGNVGFMVARDLEHERVRLMIIEASRERCEKLAQWLPKALVLQGDATDLELLEQERVEDADVFVAVTNDDGKNLLASLLAKQLGVPRVITRVSRTQNRRLFERVGIETPLTPRAAAVQEVLNWLRHDQVDRIASIEDRAEVMEFTYPERAPAGPVREIGSPPNSLIGGIWREGRVIIPHGDTLVQPGDHLFVVTTPDNVVAVEAWLERREAARA